MSGNTYLMKNTRQTSHYTHAGTHTYTQVDHDRRPPVKHLHTLEGTSRRRCICAHQYSSLQQSLPASRYFHVTNFAYIHIHIHTSCSTTKFPTSSSGLLPLKESRIFLHYVAHLNMRIAEVGTCILPIEMPCKSSSHGPTNQFLPPSLFPPPPALRYLSRWI